MNFKDVDDAFAKLVVGDNHGIGQGVGRMKPVNQQLDLAYLRGKLRLYCRTILAICQTDKTWVDLKEEDFAEAFTLLKRKEEYLAVDSGLYVFYQLSRLLKIPETEVSLDDLISYMNCYDRYSEKCSLQEKVELHEVPSSYFTYLANKGIVKLPIEVLQLMARCVHLQYGSGKKTEAITHLNASVFRMISIVGLVLIPRHRLTEINHVINWSEDRTDFTKKEWFQEFSSIYSPFLDSKIRKSYVRIQKAVSYFEEEEYLKASKIFDGFRYPDDELLSLSPLRYLYYCVFSLYYHGTPAERKNMRHRKLTPHLILDRFRKRLEYQKNKEGQFWAAKRLHQGFLTRMQAIQKAYDLVYRSTPPINVREKIVDYLIPIRQSIAEDFRPLETPWLQTQIELLEQELERQGL